MVELTGERIIPELMEPTNGMLLEHAARYHFSIPYARGRVLDIACGSGYGSHMIAKSCKEEVSHVVGVDNDKEIIEYAKRTYDHPRITFKAADAVSLNLPEEIGSFDTIISFETIEHIRDEIKFMKNVYKMLLPEGTLVLSTPFGQGRGEPCGEPFHIHQLTETEFKNLFRPFQFEDVVLYFQRGVVFEPEQSRRDLNYTFGVAVCVK